VSFDRFLRYDVTELRACAERWIEDAKQAHPWLAQLADPDGWSELTLDWLASVAAERARVDASAARPHLVGEPREGWPDARTCTRAGPFAMTHVAQPRFDETPHGYAYWERALSAERLETLLVVAIEWGSGGRPAARYGRVLLGASDLVHVDARAKVIAFSSDEESERRRIVRDLTRLRLAAWDTRPWLWVDLAWRADWSEHAPSASVLEG